MGDHVQQQWQQQQQSAAMHRRLQQEKGRQWHPRMLKAEF